jgi:hypothetical protein
LSDGCRAERSTEEGDVLAFFDGGFGGVGFDGGVGEGDRGEVGFGGDGALGSCAGDGDGRGELVDGDAVDGEVVEVRLEVLEIEGEVEDVVVGEGCDLRVCFLGYACEDETDERRGAE